MDQHGASHPSPLAGNVGSLMAQAKVAGLLAGAAGTAGRRIEEGTAGAGQQSGHVASHCLLHAPYFPVHGRPTCLVG